MLVTDIPEFAPFEGTPNWRSEDWTDHTVDFRPLGKITFLYRGKNYRSPSGQTHAKWVAICEAPSGCGNVFIERPFHILNGDRVSCGCLSKKNAAMIGREGAKDKTIDPITGLCDHPQCTGNHGWTPRGGVESCSKAVTLYRIRQKRRYGKKARAKKRAAIAALEKEMEKLNG